MGVLRGKPPNSTSVFTDFIPPHIKRDICDTGINTHTHNAHTYIYIHTHAHENTDTTHTYMHISLTYSHIQYNTHIHTHMNTHIHTHKYTNTVVQIVSKLWAEPTFIQLLITAKLDF